VRYEGLFLLYSTSCNRDGVGSIETKSGRVMLIIDTSAWPGASPLTMFQSPLSMPLMGRIKRVGTHCSLKPVLAAVKRMASRSSRLLPKWGSLRFIAIVDQHFPPIIDLATFRPTRDQRDVACRRA